MRAAVLVAPGHIELQDLPVPEPGPGGIVVRVRAALTDGTDLKTYRRGHPKMSMPTRFGHEFSGDVAAAGEGVSKFKIGDPIMSVHTAPCGECFWCEHRQEELCESIMSSMVLGAYAEYLELPARVVDTNCYPKPESVSYTAAAFLEPLACVVHSLDRLNPKEEDVVLVLGDGGFGLLHAMLLQRMGIRAVLCGRRAERLELARRLGLRDTIDARAHDPSAAIGHFTGGRGADAVIECTGRQEAWEAAPNYARRGGIVSLFGGLPTDTHVAFSAERIHYDEVTLIAPFHFTPAAVRRARDLLISGEIDPLPLVTQTVSLEGIEEVFTRLDAGEGVKFAITP